MSDVAGRVIRLDASEPQGSAIDEAARLLAGGSAVIFPTDTVYGIGIAVDAASSPELLFELKRRDHAKSIPWLVASPDDLRVYGREVPDYCLELARRHWPGALTLVVRASDEVPQAFRAGDGTLALRMPDCRVALDLIRAVGRPLATTSANISGRGAVASCEALDPELAALVPLVLDAGGIMSGQPSTVVSCLGDEPRVLREGAITAGQVSAAVG